VYKVVGVLALVVGAFNIKDFFSPGAGGFEMSVPKSWRPRMKMIIAKATTTPGAFVIGLIVSLFLLPCTSGPYIVIVSMLASTATQTAAITWLLYYNLLFVLPMIAITLIVFWGLTTPEKAQTWRLSKVRYMHLIAGILIFAMGIVLLSGIV
jgi:cytochrome c biogenesis protein CcdA